MRQFYIILLFVLSSCATLSENECKNGNWELIGKKDGLKGRPLSVISQHQEACSEYKVRINTREYEIGRNQGLGEYCKPENGYQEGINGHKYNNVCTNKEFNTKYRIGYKIYELKKEIEKANKEINDLESEFTMSNNEDDKIKLRYKIRNEYDKINKINKKITLLKVYAAGDKYELIDLL